jgi:uncharacterized protein (DUF2141 family)
MLNKITNKFAKYLMLLAAPIAAQLHADTLSINIKNILSDEGDVAVQVFSNAEQYKGSAQPFIALMLTAEALKGSFSIVDLPAGFYGARVMHDLNGNGELDTNFVGRPKEPYGFSNNATANFGPPKWNDIRFQLDGSNQQIIDLNL